jgi:hypothetical protein
MDELDKIANFSPRQTSRTLVELADRVTFGNRIAGGEYLSDILRKIAILVSQFE